MYQRKSDGRWCEKIQLPGRKTPLTLTAKTQAALKKKVREFYTSKEKGPLFEEAADAWDTSHAEQVEYSTNASYAAHLRRAKEFFVDRYLADITPDEVQAYVNYLAKQGFGKATVARGLHVVNMIFNHAMTQPGSLVHYNPCTAVRVPKNLSKTRREPPTAEQLEKVSPDSEMGLFAYFLQYTGLRKGELLALRYEDIDREAKLIHVTKAVSYESNQPIIKSTKTAAGVRDVDLLDNLAAVLPDLHEGYVFGGSQPLTKIAFRKRWTAWCRSVGLAEPVVTERKGSNGRVYTSTVWKVKVTPHQFRHEYASMLEDAGVSDFTAMSLLGHASIATTKDVYTHIREGKQRRSADQLNAWVAKKK